MRRADCSRLGTGPSDFGVTQIAVRWNTVSSASFGAICGMSWTAVAPVPMTAARRPVRSRSSSHFAVWTMVPSNVSMPGISGIFGWDRNPVAVSR